jgi:hypothetical protein
VADPTPSRAKFFYSYLFDVEGLGGGAILDEEDKDVQPILYDVISLLLLHLEQLVPWEQVPASQHTATHLQQVFGR